MPVEPINETQNPDIHRAETQAHPVVMLLTRIRSIISGAFVVPYTLMVSLAVIAAGAFRLHRLGTILIRGWSLIILWIFGIHVRVQGEEHLPTRDGGIVVFNHQSHFDIPVLAVSTFRTIRFGAKIELFSIPFFGAAMRAAGTLPIARDRRSEVLKVYKEAEARFREHFIFLLAPEGTRQNEAKIGRFKNGPFLFAINGQVPVIPAVIKGSFHVMPKNSLWVNLGRWTRTIDLEYLPPISTQGLAAGDIEGLVTRVREQMVAAFDRM